MTGWLRLGKMVNCRNDRLWKRIEAFENSIGRKGEMHRERQKSITFIHREYFISHMYRHMAGRIGKRMEQQAERMERQNV